MIKCGAKFALAKETTNPVLILLVILAVVWATVWVAELAWPLVDLDSAFSVPLLMHLTTWVTADIIRLGRLLISALLSSTRVLALLRIVPVMLEVLVWAG